jgi:hypothetical protein
MASLATVNGDGRNRTMATSDKAKASAADRDLASSPARDDLNVPPNAPVTQYWSAPAYDRDTHALIRETSRSSRASNSPEVQKNADGSVDLYFGPAAPAGKESNWVPTAGRPFEILFRVYGPDKPFFEKKWVLPDVKKVSL